MPKFVVEIRKSTMVTEDVFIEAANRDEAEDRAYGMLETFDWSEPDENLTVETVRESPELKEFTVDITRAYKVCAIDTERAKALALMGRLDNGYVDYIDVVNVTVARES